MGCVDLPALPLQILLRSHPEWGAGPAAVVDRDKPLGMILWVNRAARARRVRPGMRYSAGLSLAPDLRAGVVEPPVIRAEVARLARWLQRFSPRVESCWDEPGVFWMDASGLEHLYPALQDWAAEIEERFREEENYWATVVVGFSHFGSYAATRTTRGVFILDDAQGEHQRMQTVPLESLNLEPRSRERLLRLGVRDLGSFAALPSTGVRRRFGPEAMALHRRVRGQEQERLCPDTILEPVEQREYFDLPEDNRLRLLASLEPGLHAILTELAERREALARLVLRMVFEDGERGCETLTPAAPTLELETVMTLLRLRLESVSLACGLIEWSLHGEGVAASEQQLELFPLHRKREPAAAERAFAKVRAELGNHAVVRAKLHEGHLPEARFGWEAMEQLPVPKPVPRTSPSLMRRIYCPAIALSRRPLSKLLGWEIAGRAEGPVEEVVGPHVLNGGWWIRETARDYYYLRTRSCRWFWVYHDMRRQFWFLQGEVE